MKISDAENIPRFKEFKSDIDQKCSTQDQFFLIISIVGAGIVYVSISYFVDSISEISLFLGFVGTVCIGYSSFNSRKSIYEYSLTLTEFNPEKAKIMLVSRLCTTIGTIFVLLSLILGLYNP